MAITRQMIRPGHPKKKVSAVMFRARHTVQFTGRREFVSYELTADTKTTHFPRKGR